MKLRKRSIFSFGVRPQFLLEMILRISLLMVTPLTLIYLFRADAVLYIIIYLQMLLIWAQAEIGLRQHNISRAKYGPYFTAKLEEARKGTALVIKNVSENPAYNLFIEDLKSSEDEFISEYSSKEFFIPFLNSNEKKTVFLFSDKGLMKELCQKKSLFFCHL